MKNLIGGRLVDARYNNQQWNKFYADDELSELKNIKWIDLEYVQPTYILMSDIGEKYLVVENGVKKITDLFPAIQDLNIKKYVAIDENYILAITEDGKIIEASNSEVSYMPFEKQVEDIDINNFIIMTTDGEFYVAESNETFTKVNDIFPELEDSAITDILSTETGPIILTKKK